MRPLTKLAIGVGAASLVGLALAGGRDDARGGTAEPFDFELEAEDGALRVPLFLQLHGGDQVLEVELELEVTRASSTVATFRGSMLLEREGAGLRLTPREGGGEGGSFAWAVDPAELAVFLTLRTDNGAQLEGVYRVTGRIRSEG